MHVLTSIEEVRNFAKIAKKLKWIAYDTETVGTPGPLPKKAALILHRARVFLLAFYHPSIGPYIIPTHYLDSSHLPANSVFEELREVFETVNIVMHNANYDINVTANHGVDIKNFEDTLLLAFAFDENATKSLKDLCLLVGMVLHKTKTVDFENLRDVGDYAADDAIATGRLYQLFMTGQYYDHETKSIIRNPMFRVDDREKEFYFKQDKEVLRSVIAAERRGIRIDIPYFQKLEEEMIQKLKETELSIYEKAGHEFNIRSTKQLQEVLFKEQGLEPGKITKTGFSTNEESLKLFALQNEIPKLIIEYRTVEKLRGSYVNAESGIPAMADSSGVLHASMNTLGAVTTRMSIQLPALQTIPKEESFGIRNGFVSRPGYYFLDADYNQMELRLIAIFSQDPEMLRVFSEGIDPHEETASFCNCSRQVGKTCNFLLSYGGSAGKLKRQLDLYGTPISWEEAKEIHRKFFAKYKRIIPFQRALFAFHRREKCFTYINGRRRRVGDLDSPDEKVRMGAERRCANNVIQGSGAQWIRESMIRLAKPDSRFSKLGGRVLLNVHDELLCEIPKRNLLPGKDALIEEMERPPENLTMELPIPLTVEAKWGTRWGDLHKFEE